MSLPNSVKWLAFGMVGILAIVFLMRSCSLYDEVSVLKGKHEALQIAYADLDMTMKADLEAYKADIATRDEAIAEASRTIVEVQDKIKDKDAKILNLEEEFTQLGENKDAKIVNLQVQVSIWKEKFTLAEWVIAEKDNIIFDLTAKYDTQVKISVGWESAYNRQVELHQIALERIKVMEKEWKGVRFGSKVKTYVIAAAGAALVYSLIRK